MDAESYLAYRTGVLAQSSICSSEDKSRDPDDLESPKTWDGLFWCPLADVSGNPRGHVLKDHKLLPMNNHRR